MAWSDRFRKTSGGTLLWLDPLPAPRSVTKGVDGVFLYLHKIAKHGIILGELCYTFIV